MYLGEDSCIQLLTLNKSVHQSKIWNSISNQQGQQYVLIDFDMLGVNPMSSRFVSLQILPVQSVFAYVPGLITINAFKQSLRKFKLLVWNYNENRIQKLVRQLILSVYPKVNSFHFDPCLCLETRSDFAFLGNFVIVESQGCHKGGLA